MKVKPFQLAFHMCICVQSGEEFEKGQIFPIFNSHYGWQMCYTQTKTEYGEAEVKCLINTDIGLVDADQPCSQAVFKFFVPKNETLSGRCRHYPYSNPHDDNWFTPEEWAYIKSLTENTEITDNADSASSSQEERAWNISI